eukprot:s3431_g4.t1
MRWPPPAVSSHGSCPPLRTLLAEDVQRIWRIRFGVSVESRGAELRRELRGFLRHPGLPSPSEKGGGAWVPWRDCRWAHVLCQLTLPRHTGLLYFSEPGSLLLLHGPGVLFPLGLAEGVLLEESAAHVPPRTWAALGGSVRASGAGETALVLPTQTAECRRTSVATSPFQEVFRWSLGAILKELALSRPEEPRHLIDYALSLNPGTTRR